jgi:hypothetical protein
VIDGIEAPLLTAEDLEKKNEAMPRTAGAAWGCGEQAKEFAKSTSHVCAYLMPLVLTKHKPTTRKSNSAKSSAESL